MIWTSCREHSACAPRVHGGREIAYPSNRDDAWRVRIADQTATWTFDPANSYLAKQSRNEYLAILNACGSGGGDYFAAELVYRELMSNALRHAPGNVGVELRWSETYPVLSVDDGSALFCWTGELPSNASKERGRGLYLVKAFARELRIASSPGSGHKVSAVLPIERNSNHFELGVA
jgi:anti-sigma regulatory factor (Ser/Thr protein kinase)